eukprot:TRINITY_DN8464_c0_g1_i3.p1 TRINITY_DN8464_c0_g1~~TRINITY_DN8464_c0_g1_i3.p1  ORF type:complete len:158 (+),score=21.06 TRINITY_DN8464_c0_g1_i3:147-620(+)
MSTRETNQRLIKVHAMTLLLNYGFDSSEEQALSLMSDLMIKYIQKLGTTSKHICELAGRQSVNMFDVLYAFKDLSIKESEITNFMKEKRTSLTNKAVLNLVKHVNDKSTVETESYKIKSKTQRLLLKNTKKLRAHESALIKTIEKGEHLICGEHFST